MSLERGLADFFCRDDDEADRSFLSSHLSLENKISNLSRQLFTQA
jgi:hypothetical protein